MTAMPRGLKAIDLKNSLDYLKAPPHDLMAWLRANDPVHWNEESDGPGFWSITRHADIVRVSTDAATFSSARANGGHRIFDEAAANEAIETSMISMDPPEHLNYRRMVMPGFTPARMAQMEAGIRARGAALIERLVARWEEGGRKPVDFVDGFAAPFAIQTLAELFGVSMADGDRLFEWSNAIVAEEDPELRPSEDYAQAKIMEMLQYSFGLREQRLAAPGEDLISMLAHTQVDGAPMSPGKYLATFVLLVVAGNETTRNSITGGLLAFSDFPAERAKAMAIPALLRTGAGEIVRWVSPVHHMRRTATKDVELGGKLIRAGDKVVLWYASGNRDESVYADPFAFRIDRFEDAGVPKHLGFGTGQHVCLGQRLAELQIRVAFEELFARLPGLRPVGEGRRVRSNFINGWKDLEVDLGMPERQRENT
jgi:linalool 8-monooxygenase